MHSPQYLHRARPDKDPSLSWRLRFGALTIGPAADVPFDGFDRLGLGRLTVLADASGLYAEGTASLSEAIAFAFDRAETGNLLAPASLDIYGRIWRGFGRYARFACDADTVAAVTPAVVDRFLSTPTRQGKLPGTATRQLRRSAIRSLFRILRDTGLADHDPTLDVDTPLRATRTVRPLTDAEVELCRAAAPATLYATREPAAWALVETGGSNAEIGNVQFGDLDLRAATVVLGRDTPIERRAPLSRWAIGELRQRHELSRPSEWVLVGVDSTTNGRRTRATELVRNVMRRAGVHGPGVSARSVTAWAGVQVLVETGQIEAVALRLGYLSLDAAAALIGYDWSER